MNHGARSDSQKNSSLKTPKSDFWKVFRIYAGFYVRLYEEEKYQNKIAEM
ncbi:hypothetical protein GCM10028791_23010 [Echinicola sediminis]